jgi:hypothetical protein
MTMAPLAPDYFVKNVESVVVFFLRENMPFFESMSVTIILIHYLARVIVEIKG